MPIIQLGQNIIAGTRAALFMPVYLWSFKNSYVQVCLLLLVSLGLTFIHDYFDSYPDNYFNPYGLSYQALLYSFFFFSLSLIAFFNNRLQDLQKLIVLFLSIVPVIWLGTICLLALSEQQPWFDQQLAGWIVFIVYLLWYLLVVFRLIKRFFYLSLIKSILYVFLYGIINFTPLFLLPTELLWYASPTIDQAIEGRYEVDIESTYYAQHQLISETVRDVLPEREGITDLYFVGFAGDADEDVFMNEAIAAKTLLESQFDAFGRGLLLINNEDTLMQYPLANKPNLIKVLEETGRLMNTEEDILFLFMTSHGSKQHDLSANFQPFRLNDISVAELQQALQASRIKWKVVVISACYSGGFIDQLADPYSLIITAASADRASFGCGHDGKYTYFGKAFFEDSLKQTGSFIQAFENASQLVREKENAEGLDNSMPQMRLGEAIKDKLGELEKQINANKHSNWAYSEH